MPSWDEMEADFAEALRDESDEVDLHIETRVHVAFGKDFERPHAKRDYEEGYLLTRCGVPLDDAWGWSHHRRSQRYSQDPHETRKQQTEKRERRRVRFAQWEQSNKDQFREKSKRRRRKPVKYAIWVIADQTYVYLDNDGTWTTEHPHAKLFDDKEEARAFAIAHGCQPEDDITEDKNKDANSPWYLEEVPDEKEFRAREDTW
jgi:hypothetical protein